MSYKEDRQDANTGLIIIGIVIATIFMVFGLFVGIEFGRNEKCKKSYDDGYHAAKIIYQCDHDNAECEILKEEE